MIPHELLRILRGRMVNAIVMLLAVGFAGTATAMCVSPKEGGRWWNTDPKGDPISLEVTLDECGDQVLNGVKTETSYGVKVFVKQSNGNLYQRPKAKAKFKKSRDGKTWLGASVPTGGYVDHIWLRRNDVNGQERLYVYIKHESLDNKPSAESRYWFSRQRAKDVLDKGIWDHRLKLTPGIHSTQ